MVGGLGLPSPKGMSTHMGPCLEKRVFADVIKDLKMGVSWLNQVGSGPKDTDTETREEGHVLTEDPQCQCLLAAVRSRREAWSRCSPRAFRRDQPC